MNSLSQSKALPLTLGSSPRQLMQVAALISFWWISQRLADLMHLPIPGSLLGLVLLWITLDCKILPLDWFEHGADGLLNHLMLFFVPAMLALVDHPELLSLLGVKLIISILACTLIVMAGTAAVVELGFRLSYGSNR